MRNSADVTINLISYDGRGRAVESSLADGVDRATLSYGTPGASSVTRTVTNALGKVATYKFRRTEITAGTAYRFAGVDGQASQNCPASAS